MSKPHKTPAEAATAATNAAGTNSEEPPSAADALAIIEEGRSRTAAGLTPNLVLMYGVWGVAWMVGFGVSYVLSADLLDIPPALVITLIAATFVSAVVISIVVGVRSGRGLRGPSETTGTMYGISWMIALTGLGLLLGGIQLPDDVAGLVYPASFVLLVGVMYLFGGTLWNDRLQYGLGIWLIVVAAMSTFLGNPNNYLVLAVGGAGGLLAIAGYHAFRGATP